MISRRMTARAIHVPTYSQVRLRTEAQKTHRMAAPSLPPDQQMRQTLRVVLSSKVHLARAKHAGFLLKVAGITLIPLLLTVDVIVKFSLGVGFVAPGVYNAMPVIFFLGMMFWLMTSTSSSSSSSSRPAPNADDRFGMMLWMIGMELETPILHCNYRDIAFRLAEGYKRQETWIHKKGAADAPLEAAIIALENLLLMSFNVIPVPKDLTLTYEQAMENVRKAIAKQVR